MEEYIMNKDFNILIKDGKAFMIDKNVVVYDIDKLQNKITRAIEILESPAYNEQMLCENMDKAIEILKENKE